MRVRGIKSGFDFLTQPAGFAIGESVVPFDSAESYGKAFLVGLSNTLRVAIVGIVLATLIGTLVGIGRLSRNLLVRSLCSGYVELFRNVPLLLQLFIWYFVLTELLPPIDEALQPLPDVFFSKNGLQFPHPGVGDRAIGRTLAGFVGRLRRHRGAGRAGRSARYEATGAGADVLAAGAGDPGAGHAGWAGSIGGAPAGARHAGEDRDQRGRRRRRDAGVPDRAARADLYTAAYIAEVVRAGIQSVPYGQHEASRRSA